MGTTFYSTLDQLNNESIADVFLETMQTLVRILIGYSITAWTSTKQTHIASTPAPGQGSAVTSP